MHYVSFRLYRTEWTVRACLRACVLVLRRHACVKAFVNTRVQEREILIDCSGNNNSNKIQ